MVEEEGEDNFISKLHRNQMRIGESFSCWSADLSDCSVPWPVIQDPKFCE